MTDRLDFETRLQERLRARGARASRAFDAAAIAHQAVVAARPRRRIGTLAWPAPPSAFGWLVVALLLAIALLGAVTLVGALLPKVPPRVLTSNGWIAYSTAPHGGPSSTDITSGSDIYLVRAGTQPILIAGRADGSVLNICPAFSPDGRRLAYGVVSNQGRAIVVDGVDANGVTSDTVHIAVPGSGSAVCPRWSSDGSHVAYLDGGVVVVRGVDGSTLATVAGDPHIEDFSAPSLLNRAILSPTGDRMAWINPAALVVVSPDGADAAHAIQLSATPYAISAWSPDGRQVLLMTDVGEAFSVRAVAVDSPFEVTTIVSSVTVNGGRSWPAWGDVSWQPVETPAQSQAPAQSHAPAASEPDISGTVAFGSQPGTVALTIGGKGAEGPVACNSTDDGQLSVWSYADESEWFSVVFRSNGAVSSLSGAYRGVIWMVTRDPQGILTADRSGTFSGKDAISGADVSGTFACP